MEAASEASLSISQASKDGPSTPREALTTLLGSALNFARQLSDQGTSGINEELLGKLESLL